MRYIKIILKIVVVGATLAFLDYTLPSRDIVKIVGTEIVKLDVQTPSIFWGNPDSGAVIDSTTGQRDVRFINAVRPNEKIRVYRNEDTGWRWPPYLKFSSGNLQAEAQKSINDNKWVAVTHYGWRITLISAYPNALSIAPVSSSSVTLVPWTRIIAAIMLIIIAIIAWRIWVAIRQWTVDKLDRIRAKLN